MQKTSNGSPGCHTWQNFFISNLIDGIEEQKEAQGQARGRLLIDSWCRMHGAPNVYAIGDCTFNPESPLPATAQVASQQGSYLGRVFSKGYDMNMPVGKPPSRRIGVHDDGGRGGGAEDVVGNHGWRGRAWQLGPRSASNMALACM